MPLYPAHLVSWLFGSAPGYAFINWADNETPTEQHSELDFTDTVGQSATLTLTNTVALGLTTSITVGVPTEMSATFSVIYLCLSLSVCHTHTHLHQPLPGHLFHKRTQHGLCGF
jgi:hypothetical protein